MDQLTRPAEIDMVVSDDQVAALRADPDQVRPCASLPAKESRRQGEAEDGPHGEHEQIAGGQPGAVLQHLPQAVGERGDR